MARRIRVVGVSGAGKSEFARRLASCLQLPYLELDAVHHQAHRQKASLNYFQAKLREFIGVSEARRGGWVVDGNYATKIGNLLDVADTVVWLDFSRLLVLQRVVRRTLLRLALRKELWNGNHELWGNVCSLDPTRNVILWSWTKHPYYRRVYAAAAADSRDAKWVRLRTPGEAEAWLRSISE
jgi:adenylate kinase family enzyme